MTKIKHIVFDVGNVLIKWDAERAFLDQIPDPTERQWFLANVCNMAWNLEQDRGRSWKEAEEVLIGEFPDHEENIRTFRSNWPLMIYSEVAGTIAIFKSLLASGHDLTLLTNFAADTFEIAKVKYEFLTLSRGATVSAEIGLIKPDVQIYRHHTEAFDLSPGNTLFIDDSIHNVDGAIAAGWNGVHFQNAETLKADLERFRIDH